MKQVILAHPFERVSGNVTRAKQKLVYAENNNPAWEAPHSRQYARNFKPQMNLRYDAASGKTSFTIQTKAGVDNTEPGRLRMALFGGAQAVVNALKMNPTTLAQIYEAYATVKDEYKSFTSYMILCVRAALKTKSVTITFRANSGTLAKSFANPWVAGSSYPTITISDEILLKFAQYLCRTAIYVDGKFACGFPGTTNNKMSEFLSSKFNKLADGSTAFKDGAKYLDEEEEVLDRLGYSSYEQDGYKYAYVTFAQGSSTKLLITQVVPAGVWNIVASNVEPNA